MRNHHQLFCFSSQVLNSGTAADPAKTRRSTRHNLERVRLESDNYFAEIVSNSSEQRPIYYWIIQRKQSNDIITCGSAVDLDTARECARSVLSDIESEDDQYTLPDVG